MPVCNPPKDGGEMHLIQKSGPSRAETINLLINHLMKTAIVKLSIVGVWLYITILIYNFYSSKSEFSNLNPHY